MEPSTHATSPKKETSLPQEVLIAICYFGEVHLLRIKENPLRIKAYAKVGIGLTSVLFPG